MSDAPRSGCQLMGKVLVHLAPYGAAAVALLGLVHSGISESIDLLLYDTVITLRPAPSASAKPITIVGIDEGDIDYYGWPIDDGILCRAIERAASAGSTAIGVDLYRDEGIGPNAACLPQLARRLPHLITIFNTAEGIDPVPGSPAVQRSFNDLLVDPDGVVRRDLVHVSGQDASTVSFPLRLLEAASASRHLRRQLDKATTADRLGPWLQPRSGGYRQLDAGGFQRMLPFLQRGSFQRLSLRALADGPVDGTTAALRGRIVLIGSTAPSLKDLLQIPHSRFAKGSPDWRMPGVELHALRTAALLDDANSRRWTITTPPASMTQAMEWAALMLGAWLGEAFNSLRRSVIAVAAAVLLLGGVGIGVLWWGGLWTGIALPVIGLPMMAAVGWIRRGARNQLQRQQVQRLLGQTTSPAVAEQLWQQRDELLRDGRFEGRMLPVTILFSDTCNFTGVSEQVAPADLLDWLNRGMAHLVPAVTRRGGMVNKFTGDGMMAVFGAPLSKGPAQDARDAIEAALEIQREMEALNQLLAAEGKPAMRVRIGVHSGQVLAGSMGSSERLEYALIGDAVNCASRLESLEKTRQNNLCRVLVSSATRALHEAPDLLWQDWGQLKVKGRQEPLRIYELLGSSDGWGFNSGNAPAAGGASRR